MDIRFEVRETEKHVMQIADTKAERLEIISRAQQIMSRSHSDNAERSLSVLAIVKNRIIRNKESK